jgi:hypothetical protein
MSPLNFSYANPSADPMPTMNKLQINKCKAIYPLFFEVGALQQQSSNKKQQTSN